jgi:deoxyribodipyrimidine photo-lyase
MQTLQNKFDTRKDCANYVATLAPWLKQPVTLHPFVATREVALAQLSTVDFINYGKTRNFLDGGVTRLSPYINAHIVTLNEVRNAAVNVAHEPVQVIKFIQELGWRDFWQRIYAHHPEWLFTSIEPYKTGFDASDYSDALPQDILVAQTDCACINQFITQLYEEGYVHNHARMYLASYIVHWRKISWQAGARWMHHNLIDGNLASNNLSWQWVASTFGNKPYIFNLENVQKYAHKKLNISAEDNKPLDASYEALHDRLFPLRIDR